jgi:hypothetical protein
MSSMDKADVLAAIDTLDLKKAKKLLDELAS